MTTKYFLVFAAGSIQRYIFESGRLAEMVGASELIEQLLDEPREQLLDNLGIDSKSYEILRHAGGALTIAFDERENALDFRSAWSLLVPLYAPGLSFTLAVREGENLESARLEADKQQNHDGGQPVPEFPVAGPLIKRSPRTGKPAIQLATVKERQEWIDAATLAKRRKSVRQGSQLARRFLDDENAERFVFPRNMESGDADAFPFDSENTYVGVVHIDGNRIGERFVALGHAVSQYGRQGQQSAKEMAHKPAPVKQFSEAMTRVTQYAAQEALRGAVLNGYGDHANDEEGHAGSTKIVVPFRPLILGGDDLTAIIRADHTLEFVRLFLEIFEQQSEVELSELKQRFRENGVPTKIVEALPDVFTACAGIAFVKAKQPFYLAYDLAESLCSFAKDVGVASREQRNDSLGVLPCAVAIHRITSSFISDYSAALSEEMIVRWSNQSCRHLTLGTYGVGSHAPNLPNLGSLVALSELFQPGGVNFGPLRNVLTVLHADRTEASQAYRRWIRNLQEKDISEETNNFDYYCGQVLQLLGDQIDLEELPFTPEGRDRASSTFLGDLASLVAVTG